MAPSLKLHTYPGNKNANKALIAAEYAGVPIETPRFEMGKSNKTEAFLKLNPFGKVPTLETSSGEGVFESNAIARFVARQSPAAAAQLLGRTPIEQAQVDAWVDWSTGEVDAPLLSWFLPIAGIWPYSKEKEAAAQQAVKKALASLDAVLATKTYLVGDAVTLADVVGVCNLWLGFTKLFDAAYRASVPNVTRWFDTCVHQPAFAKVLGDVPLADKAAVYDAAAAKKAAEAPAKAAAAAPAPAAAAAGGDAAAAAPAAAAPKPKNPLDLLPPSPMALDSWKRLYSNTPASKFREIAIAGLWNGADIPNSPTNERFPGFDPEGFSIWFCDYKYPDENTVNFVVMNKVGGFLQRIDYARKYAFGAMCILKDDKGQFPIRGCWIFRGQALPPMMVDECYDLDLYNWTKVDLGDAAAKKRVEDMFAEEATIDGLEHVECKIFK